MWLRLPELQGSNVEAKNIRNKDLPKGWEDMKDTLQYQSLLYISEIICFKEISCNHNDPLTGHFKINKIKKLVDKKFF